MADAKKIYLVTGGNVGIGFELVSQLLDNPHNHVILAARALARGEAALTELQQLSKPGSVELVQLDVDDMDSIASAASSVELRHGRLDGLVNNAAHARNPAGTLPEAMLAVFKTNTIGPLMVAEHFKGLLQRADGARIVNMTSGAGSISRRLSAKSSAGGMDHVAYCSSKSALHAVSACQLNEYGPAGVKVFVYNPGFTVTSRGAPNTLENGAQPTSVGAAPIVQILYGERDAEQGLLLMPQGHIDW